MDLIYGAGENDGMEEEKKKKKKWSGKRKAFWIFMVCMVIVATLAGNRAAAFKWKIQSTLNLMDRDSSNVIENVDKEFSVNTSDTQSNGEIINILLVGADKRSTWKEDGRSDSCMIATLDMKNEKIKITSIMRDIYIDIPDKGKHKFNAAYSYGGVELLYKTILSNFGVSVQGYVVVDFEAFRKVIDTLGGVEINLTEEEYSILMSRYHRTSVLKLKPGLNNMNGTQALAYCRLRQDLKGDFGRTERQRNVLNQIFLSMKSKPISKWYETAEAVMPFISTDLSNDEIFSLLKNVVFMGTTDVEQLRIPVDGTYKNGSVNGQLILETDIKANKKAINEYIFGKDEIN